MCTTPMGGTNHSQANESDVILGLNALVMTPDSIANMHHMALFTKIQYHCTLLNAPNSYPLQPHQNLEQLIQVAQNDADPCIARVLDLLTQDEENRASATLSLRAVMGCEYYRARLKSPEHAPRVREVFIQAFTQGWLGMDSAHVCVSTLVDEDVLGATVFPSALNCILHKSGGIWLVAVYFLTRFVNNGKNKASMLAIPLEVWKSAFIKITESVPKYIDNKPHFPYVRDALLGMAQYDVRTITVDEIDSQLLWSLIQKLVLDMGKENSMTLLLYLYTVPKTFSAFPVPEVTQFVKRNIALCNKHVIPMCGYCIQRGLLPFDEEVADARIWVLPILLEEIAKPKNQSIATSMSPSIAWIRWSLWIVREYPLEAQKRVLNYFSKLNKTGIVFVNVLSLAFWQFFKNAIPSRLGTFEFRYDLYGNSLMYTTEMTNEKLYIDYPYVFPVLLCGLCKKYAKRIAEVVRFFVQRYEPLSAFEGEINDAQDQNTQLQAYLYKCANGWDDAILYDCRKLWRNKAEMVESMRAVRFPWMKSGCRVLSKVAWVSRVSLPGKLNLDKDDLLTDNDVRELQAFNFFDDRHVADRELQHRHTIEDVQRVMQSSWEKAAEFAPVMETIGGHDFKCFRDLYDARCSSDVPANTNARTLRLFQEFLNKNCTAEHATMTANESEDLLNLALAVRCEWLSIFVQTYIVERFNNLAPTSDVHLPILRWNMHYIRQQQLRV